MEILDARQDLMEEAASLLVLKPFLLNDVVEKLTARHELHDQKKLSVRFNYLIKLNDVGVSNDFENLNFTHDTGNIGLIFNFILFQYFHRNLFICQHMSPKAHLTKGTLSNCVTYRKTHII
jgi:hypothetical protein